MPSDPIAEQVSDHIKSATSDATVPPADADGPFRYFASGDGRAVRFVMGPDGRPVAAHTQHPSHNSELRADAKALSEQSIYFANLEITKARFVEVCRYNVKWHRILNSPFSAIAPVDADGPYKYYLRDYGIPVRAMVDAFGRNCRAHAPDRHNGNELGMRALSVIETNDSVDDITKRQFVEVCRLYRDDMTQEQLQEAIELLCPLDKTGHVVRG